MHVTNEILEPTKIFPWKRKILKLKPSPYYLAIFTFLVSTGNIFFKRKSPFKKIQNESYKNHKMKKIQKESYENRKMDQPHIAT